MQRFKFCAGLRKELIEQIGGIKDASYTLWWDDTAPNYSTRRSLSEIFERHVALAADHGLLIVTRHSDCSNKPHSRYPTSNRYDLSIPYRSKEYVWEGDQLYQGSRFCTCPCSPRNAASEHHVIDDFVYKKGSDLIFCRQIASVLSDLRNAIENAGDNKPRSGIREYLLRALLTLNDAILPEPMERYITRQQVGEWPK